MEKTYLQQLIQYIETQRISQPLTDEEMRIWYRAMELRTKESIDESEAKLFKYKLVTAAGEYYANSLWSLLSEIISHRLWHLRKHGKWMD